jgi:hypothetical protein
MADASVILVAVMFFGMGVAALARPKLIGSFFDVRFDSIDGRNEVRAVYGGFGLAMTLALWLAATEPELRRGVLTTVALALAGMALGRVASALVERPGLWPWFFCALEITGAALLFRAGAI